MKIFNLFLAVLLWGTIISAGTLIYSNTAYGQSGGLVTVRSNRSFNKTLDEIHKMVAKNGMMVLSTLNQGKILSMTGLSIKAESLFIGNPHIGNKLFSTDRGVGIAVPVRLNVYEGTDGKTYVNYVKPSEELNNFNNGKIKKIAQMLDKKLGMLTSMLTKQ